MEAKGNYTSAKTAYESAYQVFASAFGPYNPQFIRGSVSLGLLNWKAGNVASATDYFRIATQATDQEINDVIPVLSFGEQRLFLDRLPGRASILLSYAAEQQQLEQLYSYVFQWKGLLIENLRRNTLVSALAHNPKYMKDVERLQNVRAQLAGWYQRLGALSRSDWEARNAILTAEKENLERSLAAALPEGTFLDYLRELGLKGFRSLLQNNEIFVDIYQYDRYSNGKELESRYAAVVLTSNQGPHLKDLGSASEIHRLISNWKQAVLRGDSATVEWNSLRTSLWNPIAGILPPDAYRIWLSPDGELSRIPWNLFPPAGHENTIQELVSVVDSPRELVNLRRARANTQPTGILLVGDINYGNEGSKSTLQYKSLKKTRNEITSIANLAKSEQIEVTALTGSFPTKVAVLASIQKHKYVHLATHAFFPDETEDLQKGTRSAPLRGVWGENPVNGERNPLVATGIALSGANSIDLTAAENPGLLTAEELVGSNMSGVELFVLSACGTGRGTEVTGQGVLGLRASIMAAGSQSVLMSLWKVRDDATAELMKRFYANLWKRKISKAQALLEAQLAMRDEAGPYQDPVNWAGWILAGESW